MLYVLDNLKQAVWCYYLEQVEKVGDLELWNRMDAPDPDFNPWSILNQMVEAGHELVIGKSDAGVGLEVIHRDKTCCVIHDNVHVQSVTT